MLAAQTHRPRAGFIISKDTGLRFPRQSGWVQGAVSNFKLIPPELMTSAIITLAVITAEALYSFFKGKGTVLGVTEKKLQMR